MPKIFLNLDTSEAWGRSLTLGVVEYATIHGYWMLYRQPPLALTKNLPKPIHSQLIYGIREYKPDGIITLEPNRQEEKELASLGIQTIIAGHHEGRYLSFANVILVDNVAMGRMAAEHLLERGLNFFAFCGYDFYWSKDRCGGFVQTIEEAGYKVQIHKQPTSLKKGSRQTEQIIMADWLKSLAKPTGLMVSNDPQSMDVIEACKIADLHIPIDIAVIGANNDDLLCYLSPQPLSSVAIDAERAGYQAAELMDKMIKGEAKMTGQTIVVHPTHIVPRQSTDTLDFNDEGISRAIHYIRDNPRKLLQVDDVAKASMMSKRTLQIKFRKAIGHSVHYEIKKTQTDYIAQLLRDTNMSISQIARTIGYPGTEHISRLMQKVKGMSALQYRKQFGRQ